MSNRRVPITFRLEKVDIEKIRYIAKQEACSVNDLLEGYCIAYIEKHEKEYGKIVPGSLENKND